MKAFFIDGPGKASYGELPRPDLAPGHVRLKIEKIGYCGSDLNTFRGLNPLVSYPRVPGHEIAGTIIERGEAVPDDLPLGKMVTINPYKNCGQCPACRTGRINACRNNETMGVQREGALTEEIVAPQERVVRAELQDPTQLALVEPFAVGFHAVRRAAVVGQDLTAVYGCGAIGLGVIAGCRARGAEVVAIDIDDTKLAIAKALGAKHVINSDREGPEKAIAAITGGDGVNVAFEAVGLPETFLGCIAIAAPVGRVVYIGYAKTPVTYETKHFLVKELDVLGSRGAEQQDFEAVVRYMNAIPFPTEAVVTRTYDFDHAADALADWRDNPGNFTKIMVQVA